METYHTEESWISWIDTLSYHDHVVVDDYLREADYAEVRSYLLDRLPAFSPAGIGALADNTINKQIRSDNTYWLDSDRDEDLRVFWTLVDETMQMFNRYCFLSLAGYEFHFAHYPVGSYYGKHLDQFAHRNNRMISVVIYLNENWQAGDGGELEIFQNEGSVIIQPLARRCVLFKSADVLHQVLPAQKSRFSLTGWLLYQPARLGQFL